MPKPKCPGALEWGGWYRGICLAGGTWEGEPEKEKEKDPGGLERALKARLGALASSCGFAIVTWHGSPSVQGSPHSGAIGRAGSNPKSGSLGCVTKRD